MFAVFNLIIMRRIEYLDTKILLETFELGCCHLTENENLFMIIRKEGLMEDPHYIYCLDATPEICFIS